MSDLYQIPHEYLTKAKAEEINMIRKRVDKRKKEMIHLINRAVIKHCSEYEEEFNFDIAQSILQNMTNNITLPLSLWDGGRKYQSPITDYKQAHKKVRTYWNREKPAPLGDELFSGIIGALFLYVINEFDPDLTIINDQRLRLLLFVDIFQVLVDENIKFDKSMRRPLILHACFFKSAKFKQFCVKFISCFGLKWDHSVQVTRSVRDENGKSRSEYVRNENRSQDLHDSFVVVLREIRSLLDNKSLVINMEIRERIQDLIEWIKRSSIATKNGSKLMDDNKENNYGGGNLSVGTNTNTNFTTDTNQIACIYDINNNGYGPSHGSNDSLSVKRMRFNPCGYGNPCGNGYGLSDSDEQNLNHHDHCIDPFFNNGYSCMNITNSYSSVLRENGQMTNGYHEMKDQLNQYNPSIPRTSSYNQQTLQPTLQPRLFIHQYPVNPPNSNNHIMSKGNDGTDTPKTFHSTPTTITPITQPLCPKKESVSHDMLCILPSNDHSNDNNINYSKNNETCWHFPTSTNNKNSNNIIQNGIFQQIEGIDNVPLVPLTEYKHDNQQIVKYRNDNGYNHPFVVTQDRNKQESMMTQQQPIDHQTSSCFPQPRYVAQHRSNMSSSMAYLKPMQHKQGLFNDEQYQQQYQQQCQQYQYHCQQNKCQTDVSCCCFDIESRYKQNCYHNNCEIPSNTIYVSNNNMNNMNNMEVSQNQNQHHHRNQMFGNMNAIINGQSRNRNNNNNNNSNNNYNNNGYDENHSF